MTMDCTQDKGAPPQSVSRAAWSAQQSGAERLRGGAAGEQWGEHAQQTTQRKEAAQQTRVGRAHSAATKRAAAKRSSQTYTAASETHDDQATARSGRGTKKHRGRKPRTVVRACEGARLISAMAHVSHLPVAPHSTATSMDRNDTTSVHRLSASRTKAPRVWTQYSRCDGSIESCATVSCAQLLRARFQAPSSTMQLI